MKKIFRNILIFAVLLACCFSVYGCGKKEDTYFVATGVETGSLRVNSMTDPLGIDSTPLFSWRLQGSTRGISQKSYRVVVADSKQHLQDKNYVWDSGEVQSAETANIRYAGVPLQVSTKYWWNVTVTTQDGQTYTSEKPATFETGLLSDGFGNAKWITAGSVDARAVSTNGMHWIWKTGGAAYGQVPAGTQYFRREFNVASEKSIDSAYVAFSADDCGTVYLNGTRVGDQPNAANSWQSGTVIDVTDKVQTGRNVFAAKVINGEIGYAGLLARVTVFYTDGSMDTYATDKNWIVSDASNDGCIRPDYEPNDSWQSPDQVSAYGANPWGNQVSFRSTENPASPMLRRRFTLNADIVSARVYATAAGIYDLYINGDRVGDALLAPGASEFIDRLYYQTYDVTQYVKGGANVIGAMLGNGWYRSGIMHGYEVSDPAFLCKLVVTYSDGTSFTVNSDELWRFTTESPVIYNDFYNGEDYDATKEIDGWCESTYNADTWEQVSVTDAETLNIGEIVAEEAGQVRVMDVLDAVKMTEPQEGVYIYDFGQNFAGNVQIRIKGERGQKIKLRYGEMLNDKSGTGDGPEGTLYTANLRTARSTDTYILRGDKDGETWSPTFTYHGFRYLEITGIDEPLPLDAVKGLVIYSDMEDTGSFTSSNELINQLWSNAYWSQRSNFLSVPTDCPQRDERAAWLGDAQIFVGTAAYNMDVKQFYAHFTDAMNDGQKEDGPYTDVAPGALPSSYGRGGWGDAGIIVPYTMYLRYGDASQLVKYYSNMSKYIDYLVRDSGNDFIRDTQPVYGDWLAIEETPIPVTDTAYCVYACTLMSKIAKITGHDADVAKFSEYAEKFRSAWCRAYLKNDGSTRCDTQTSYVLGICFDIIPDNMKKAAAQKLVENLFEHDYTLTTGFLGVSYLLPALSESGYDNVAFKMFEQTNYPSWLYPVLQGATTIWERWNSYTLDSGFGGAGMNSFNHYSYGSVMEWVYNTVLGIRVNEENPGFTQFDLYPTYGGSFTYVKGSYHAQSGLIESGWELGKNDFTYTCTVPANTTATLYLPVRGEKADVRESNKKIEKAEGVTFVGYENGRMVFRLQSGRYTFTVK